MNPKVSVVMSVYNGEDFLHQAIKSVLTQTFTDFEFLIVNDGSTDGTGEILASYYDPRIIVIKNEENVGLAASLNRAITMARGEYIARQDADDISYPERFTNQVALLDSNPEIGIVGVKTEQIDSQNKVLQVLNPPTQNAELQATMLRFCCLIHGSTMFRRSAALNHGGYNIQMRTGQDYDFWLRISENWDMVSLPHSLYCYRRHDGMASQERQAEQTRNANASCICAIERRLAYGWGRLGLSRRIFSPLDSVDRSRLAQRYVWWSAGSRETSRKIALQFLLISLLLDPLSSELRSYVRGILSRKIGLSK